jgi:Uma2 family endonuclease
MTLALARPPLPNFPGQSVAGWTWEDYQALTDDGHRYELLEGDLAMSPSPTRDHQFIVGCLYRRLVDRIADRGAVLMAPFDVHLDHDTVVQPDVLVALPGGRSQLLNSHLEGIPDLVVEVLSDRNRDAVRKRRMYAAVGVPEYWLADPHARTLTVWRHDGHGYPDAPTLAGDAPVISGLALGEPMPVRWWLG